MYILTRWDAAAYCGVAACEPHNFQLLLSAQDISMAKIKYEERFYLPLVNRRTRAGLFWNFTFKLWTVNQSLRLKCACSCFIDLFILLMGSDNTFESN